MKNILLDTNILLAAADGFSLFSELEEQYPGQAACTVQQVIDELEKLKDSTGTKRQAMLALALAKRQHLKIVSQSSSYTDDALLEAAKQLGASLATQDAELQQRAQEAGISVLSIRKRKLLRPITHTKR